ncbi:hypothetical protein [Aeromonas media]|uniref:hypothetical protein n=1 Tax=Aeromonas media TaxID=651 RepID=UPI0022805407|nr:hypothetical protein [Aeromonas media]MCY9822645.1 hypothetical protein [Aeromonas media]
MGDYSDLCEMYGRSPSDPDFIDDLIESISDENRLYEEKELRWLSKNKHYKTLNQNLSYIEHLCYTAVDDNIDFNLMVMLHSHVISSFESYLSFTFTQKVMKNKTYKRKLIECESYFSKTKFNFSEFYLIQDSLDQRIKNYLEHVLFHNLKNTVPLFKGVLDYEFDEDDLEWLGSAINLRHDCVHRAGHNLSGNKVDVSRQSILQLIENINVLAKDIESSLRKNHSSI